MAYGGLQDLEGADLDKEVRRMVRDATVQLKSAQQGEMYVLRQMGADKDTLKAERQANSQERKDLKTSMAGLTADTAATFKPVTSTQTTASPYSEGVQKLATEASGLLTKYNLNSLSAKGDDRQGFGVNPLMRTLYNKEQGTLSEKDPYGQMLTRAEQSWGQNLTAEQIAKNGKLESIKPVKGSEDLYQVNRGYEVGNNDKMKISDQYKLNADGTYTPAGYDRYHQEVKEKKNGLGTALGLLGTVAFGLPMLGIPGVATAAIGSTANTIGSLASSAAGMSK